MGSLATRSEIVAELILNGGTEAQKSRRLPKIARAEVLPSAAFTELDTGSDLGSLRARAVRGGADHAATGNKTWISHAARKKDEGQRCDLNADMAKPLAARLAWAAADDALQIHGGNGFSLEHPISSVPRAPCSKRP